MCQVTPVTPFQLALTNTPVRRMTRIGLSPTAKALSRSIVSLQTCSADIRRLSSGSHTLKANGYNAAMSSSTFQLPDVSSPVTVNLPADLSQDQLLSFPAFRRWISTLRHSLSLQATAQTHPFSDSPYRLRTIDVQSVDFFGGGRLGFVKLKADISNDDGERLPGSVFLRGPSVGMLVWYLSPTLGSTKVSLRIWI